MNPRRLLIICYYFPPLGLAGVRRPLALLKKLTALGHQVDILTVKPVTYFVYEPELLEGLDSSRIFRAGSTDPQRLMYLLGKRTITPQGAGTAKTLSPGIFPDSKKGWVRPAIKLGRTLIENYRYDLLISTSPPVSAHLVARKLAAEFKTPWIADFRDFWSMVTIEEEYDQPGLIKRANELLTGITTEANEVTGVNQTIIDYLKRGVVIRNGFDADRARLWTDKAEAEKFVLGVPSNQIGRGKIDPLWKLLAAVEKLSPGILRRITLLQAGVTDAASFTAEASELSTELAVECKGYLKGDSYLTQLSRASAFYVGLTDDMSDSIVPSRIFELLASGREIFAYCDKKSELAKLITKNRCGVSFDRNTVAQAAVRLKSLIEAHFENQPTLNPFPDYVHEYSTDRVAESFAEIMERLS